MCQAEYNNISSNNNDNKNKQFINKAVMDWKNT